MKQKEMGLRVRLIIMNFLQFAVWGAYLTSMGSYLAGIGQGTNIGLFYSMQGITSLFMPAIIGIIADRWIPAQRLYGICHFIAGCSMLALGYYGMTYGASGSFGVMISLYAMSIGFYMPSMSLSYSVAYNALERAGLDTVTTFPPIRTFGTVGFICTMLLVDILGFQTTHMQFIVSGATGIALALYATTLPPCPVNANPRRRTIADVLGLNAFSLFKNRTLATFFIFSLLVGVALQITNSFANPFITSFKAVPEYADSFGANHANMLISISQCSETLCILLIPFFLKRYGIKNTMLVAMLAWTLRFGLFGLGNPGSGVWMFILSMIVYGVAFDFFNISGSLFVNQETSHDMRSSAQGLLLLMNNGIGATIGTLGAQAVVNIFTHSEMVDGQMYVVGDWSSAWYIFAAYSLVVCVLCAVFFKYKPSKKQEA